MSNHQVHDAIVLILLGGLLASCSEPSPASMDPDAALIASFQAHRASFEKLREMMADDKAKDRRFVGIDAVPERDADFAAMGMTRERYRTYRETMRSLGLKNGGFEGFTSADVLKFDVNWALGASVTGTKGYAYCTTPPDPLLPSLDDFRRPRGVTSAAAYRHIEGNWYIFLVYYQD